MQHNVIKFVSDLRQVGGFLYVLQFPPSVTSQHSLARYVIGNNLITHVPPQEAFIVQGRGGNSGSQCSV
jgi:hypothetical protein